MHTCTGQDHTTTLGSLHAFPVLYYYLSNKQLPSHTAIEHNVIMCSILMCNTPCTYQLLDSVGTLRVIIRRAAGALTVAQSYSLTCTIILDGITGSPTIVWLGANNNPVSNSSSVTAENKVMVNDSAFDSTLVFFSLHTSHGGQYICRGVLGRVSAMADTNLSVQSVCLQSIATYINGIV